MATIQIKEIVVTRWGGKGGVIVWVEFEGKGKRDEMLLPETKLKYSELNMLRNSPLFWVGSKCRDGGDSAGSP